MNIIKKEREYHLCSLSSPSCCLSGCPSLCPVGDTISAGLISLFNWSRTVAVSQFEAWPHARLK